jgi:hypothetical protein
MKTEGKGSDIGVQGSRKGINRSGISIDAGCLKAFGIPGRQEGYTLVTLASTGENVIW